MRRTHSPLLYGVRVNGQGPAATVVVPTFNRPTALASCLAALESQTIRADLEVIVVHDGEAASETPPKGASVLVTTKERRGPAAARNAGAERASANRILFIDDDCIAAPDWAERMISGLERAQVVAGMTTSAANRYARASQAIVDVLMRPEPNGSLAFAPTMNLGCETAILRSFPFDDSFGAAAGEDRAWCHAVRAEGVSIVPLQNACVEHNPSLSLGLFIRQHMRYGRGSVTFRKRYGQGLAATSFYADLIRHGFASGPAVGSLVLLAQAATAAGALRERFARVRR
jgi:glycosyltransferase involved in cell wall biosynthesis